jgi:cytidyltransferase-like protein
MTAFKWFFIKEQTGRKIVLFPGSFKPPHLGHFKLIESFKNKVGQDGIVNVIVTDPSPKSRRYTPGGKYVPADVAADILRRYVAEMGLRGVNITTAKNAVGEVYDFVREDALPGDQIIVGVGGKGNDKARYSGILKGLPAGVTVNIDVADVVGDESGAFSASNFRDLLDNLSIENLLPYIPENLRNNKSLVGYVFDKLSNLPSD